MFVRWQKRSRKRRYRDRDPDVHLAAILVESRRVNDKPTQRHQAYLGGITKRDMEVLAQRVYFWQSVAEQLDRLKLNEEQRKKVELALVKVVGSRPTSAEEAQVKRDFEQLMQGLRTSGFLKN